MSESWLQNHIKEVCAIGVILFTAILDLMALFKIITANENLSVIVITSFSNFTLMILSYYFGNSQFRTKPSESKNVLP